MKRDLASCRKRGQTCGCVILYTRIYRSSSVISADWAPVPIFGCAMSLYEPIGRDSAVAKSRSYSVKFQAQTVANRSCTMYVSRRGLWMREQ